MGWGGRRSVLEDGERGRRAPWGAVHRGSLCGTRRAPRGSTAEPDVRPSLLPPSSPPPTPTSSTAPLQCPPRSSRAPHPGAQRGAHPGTPHGTAHRCTHRCAPPRNPPRSPALHPSQSPPRSPPPHGSRADLAPLGLQGGAGGRELCPLLGWESAVSPPPSGCPHISGCCAHGLGVSVRPLPCTEDGADPPPPPPLRGGAPPSPPAPPRSQPSDAKQELPWQQVGEFQLLLQQQGQEGGNGGGGAHKRGGSRP